MHLVQLPLADADRGGDGPGTDSLSILDALDCLRVGVTLYDSHQRLTYANQHFGYVFRSMPPPSALIGQSYADLVRLEMLGGEIDTIVHSQSETAFIAQRCEQLSEDDFRPRDIHLSDGRIIEIKSRRIGGGGWIVLWSDATRARHDFARLETAVGLSADAFALWDRDDRLVMWNTGFTRLHGCRHDQELAGLSFAEVIGDAAERGRIKLGTSKEAWIAKRLAAHHAQAGALTMESSDGTAYLVRERATRDGGRATVYTDVTDRQRAEAALAEQRANLQQTRAALSEQASYLADLAKRLDSAEQDAATAKTTLLRTMSHELKTPLNAIIGFSDLLKSAPDHFSGEQIGEYAALIHAAGGNLLKMLNQIMDLTKIAAGRYPIEPGAVGLRTLFDAAYDAAAARAEDKAITLVIEPAPEIAIHGDEAALTAMVTQLVQNAVAFTQNGGTVTISAARTGDRVQVRIADNGPGVAAKDLARIVEPFEQIGRDTASATTGGGLGLPLVKALTELQDGALQIDSAHGEGLTATLDLPAA